MNPGLEYKQDDDSVKPYSFIMPICLYPESKRNRVSIKEVDEMNREQEST